MERNAITIKKKFNEYLIPTILMAVASNLAVIVDSIIVGNLIGSSAMAAISLFTPFTQLYFATTILIGMGSTTLVSGAKGKGDNQEANNIFSVAFFLLLLFSTLYVSVQLIFADPICGWLTNDKAMLPLIKEYYLPFVLNAPLQIALMSGTYYIRLENRPKFASELVIIANVLNLILDLVFIKGLNMGVAGASWATFSGYAVGVLIMLTHFWGKRSSLSLVPVFLKQVKKTLKKTGEILSIGIAAALGALLVVVKIQFLNTLVQKSGGGMAMVAYSVCNSASIFISLFITGVSQTMTTIIGVNMGERDFTGVRYVLRRAFSVLFIASLVITILMLAFPTPIIGLFGVTGAAELSHAVPALRISAVSFLSQSILFLLLYYYTSVRQKSLATTISVTSGVAFLIPITVILEKLMGVTGIWWSFTITNIATILVILPMIYMIRKRSGGRFKNFYLIEEKPDNEVVSHSFQASIENAVGISEKLSKELCESGLEKMCANQIALVAEEIAVDICKRAGRKTVYIDIWLLKNKESYSVILRNNGKAFDMTEPANIGHNEGLVLGLDLVKKIAQKIEYSNVLGFNNLTIYISTGRKDE